MILQPFGDDCYANFALVWMRNKWKGSWEVVGDGRSILHVLEHERAKWRRRSSHCATCPGVWSIVVSYDIEWLHSLDARFVEELFALRACQTPRGKIYRRDLENKRATFHAGSFWTKNYFYNNCSRHFSLFYCRMRTVSEFCPICLFHTNLFPLCVWSQWCIRRPQDPHVAKLHSSFSQRNT